MGDPTPNPDALHAHEWTEAYIPQHDEALARQTRRRLYELQTQIAAERANLISNETPPEVHARIKALEAARAAVEAEHKRAVGEPPASAGHHGNIFTRRENNFFAVVPLGAALGAGIWTRDTIRALAKSVKETIWAMITGRAPHGLEKGWEPAKSDHKAAAITRAPSGGREKKSTGSGHGGGKKEDHGGDHGGGGDHRGDHRGDHGGDGGGHGHGH